MATINVQARLVKIEDLSFFLHTPKVSDPSSISSESYNVNVGGHLEVNPDKELITVVLVFDIKSTLDSVERPQASLDDKYPSMHYVGAMTYLVRGINLGSSNKANTISLPTALVHRLGEASYSTFRGIIFSKCTTDILRDIPIPILSDEQLAAMLHPKQAITAKKITSK